MKPIADAINVVGLERSFADRREAGALLGRLNHERDLIRRHIPAVVLIWLPDFALATLARGAPDFWAWRSGVYEIPGQAELVKQELFPAFSVFAEGDAVWSLSVQKRQEEVTRLEKLLEPTKDVPPEGEFRRQTAVADRLESLAMLDYALGYPHRASRFYNESLDIWLRVDQRTRAAKALHRLGILTHKAEDFTKARSLYARSLQIAQEVSDANRIQAIWHDLGILAQNESNLDQARQLYEQSLNASKEVENGYWIAIGLVQLGELAQEERDVDEARVLYSESISQSWKMRILNRNAIGIAANQLGQLAKNEGDMRRAWGFFLESLETLKEFGDAELVATVLYNLGTVAKVEHNRSEALQSFRRAAAIFDHLNSRKAALVHEDIAVLEAGFTGESAS